MSGMNLVLIFIAVIASVLVQLMDLANEARREAERRERSARRAAERIESDRWNALSLQEREAEIWASAPGPAAPGLTLRELEAKIEAALCRRAHRGTLHCSTRFDRCILSVEHVPDRESGVCKPGEYAGRAFRYDLERIVTFETEPSTRGSIVEGARLQLRFALTAEEPHKSLSQDFRQREAALDPLWRDIEPRRRLSRWLDAQEPG
ncbi:MAG: hypothetical protein AAFZ06_16475, partial [Pseudomonadota bacterium]